MPKYERQRLLFEGDFCTLHECAYEDRGVPHKGVLKAAKNEKDNDLLGNETEILGLVFPASQQEVDHYRFLPRLVDSYFEDGRRVNVFPWYHEYLSLAQICRAYPKGIDYRDMVWMFKRILDGLGFVHERWVIHGAVTPSHVLIHPIEHGAKIIDWSYALNLTPREEPDEEGGGRRTAWAHLEDDDVVEQNPYVKAISGPYRAFYPPEILAKEEPTAASDIYMAAKCAFAVVNDDVPKAIASFLSSCTEADPAKRPQNAWDAYEGFDDLLHRVIGKPKYRKFEMPLLRP